MLNAERKTAMVIQVNLMHQLQMHAVNALSEKANAHRYRIRFMQDVTTDDALASITIYLIRVRDSVSFNAEYDFMTLRRLWERSGQLEKEVRDEITRMYDGLEKPDTYDRSKHNDML